MSAMPWSGKQVTFGHRPKSGDQGSRGVVKGWTGSHWLSQPNLEFISFRDVRRQAPTRRQRQPQSAWLVRNGQLPATLLWGKSASLRRPE